MSFLNTLLSVSPPHAPFWPRSSHFVLGMLNQVPAPHFFVALLEQQNGLLP